MGFFGVMAAHSPHSNSSLNKQSNASLSSPVLISSRHIMGGIPPGLRGRLCFLPLKSDGLFRWCHAPEWKPGENRAWVGPLWNGKEPCTFQYKSLFGYSYFRPPGTANQSSSVSLGFDAHNLKLPSKISSALRCFFSWLFEQCNFPVAPGKLGRKPGPACRSPPEWSDCNFILSTRGRVLLSALWIFAGSLGGRWECPPPPPPIYR